MSAKATNPRRAREGGSQSAPGRVAKRLLRLPAALYALRAGWLLGHRFLLLTHRGRRSGALYRTVLEVVAWDPGAREAVVMSGFGRKSQWYRNVSAGGALQVTIAKLRFEPGVRFLDADEAAEVLRDYERRNRLLMPIIRRVFSRLAGFPYDGQRAARTRLVQILPLVAFRPRDE